MAKIIDLRNCGGQLVILGDAMAVPTSNSATFSDTSPRVAGSLRFNPDLNRIEFLSAEALDWLSLGGVAAGDLSAYVEKAGDTISGNLTMTGTARVRAIDGTAGSPSYTFASATSTGMAIVSGALVLSVGGTARVSLTANSSTFSNKIVTQDGSVSAPGISFSSSANSGLYYANSSVGLSSNGVDVFQFSANAFVISNHLIPSTTDTYDAGSSLKKFRAMYATTFNGVATSAKYADLAERYASDQEYDVGTVLVLGGTHEVTAASSPYSPRVAGIVSANPGFRMNDEAGDDITHPMIALRGRVPCKVVGPVAKGDLLVTSEVVGHAMSATSVPMGALVGKSLEDFAGGFGIIEVMV